MMKEKQFSDVLIAVGGIISDEDIRSLISSGIKIVYTPNSHSLNAVMLDFVNIIYSKNS